MQFRTDKVGGSVLNIATSHKEAQSTKWLGQLLVLLVLLCGLKAMGEAHPKLNVSLELLRTNNTLLDVSLPGFVVSDPAFGLFTS